MIAEILPLAIRAFLVGALPFVLGVSLVGIVFGVLQGATGIHDSASAYAVRLLALIAGVYLCFQSIAHTVIMLANEAFQ